MTELKNEELGLWLARHPIGIRLLGWIVIPIIALSAVYIISIPLIEQNYDPVAVVACLFLGGSCLYMSYRAFTVFPYLRADVEFGENGFSIFHSNGKEAKYSWSDIGRVQHSGAVQVLSIYDKSGNRILALTEQATSFNKFCEFLNSKANLNL